MNFKQSRTERVAARCSIRLMRNGTVVESTRATRSIKMQVYGVQLNPKRKSTSILYSNAGESAEGERGEDKQLREIINGL